MDAILDTVRAVLSGMFTAEDSIWANLMAHLPEVIGGYLKMALPFVGVAACLALILFGEKILPYAKAVAFFLAGFFASMYWLIPMLDNMGFLASMPGYVPYLIAAFVAITAAVFNGFLYIVAYSGVFAGGAFAVLYFGIVTLPIKGFTFQGNAVFSGAVAALVLIAAFAARKFVEKLGTAGVGATGLFLLVTRCFGLMDMYNNFCDNVVGAFGPYVKFVFIGVVTLIGVIVQFKSKKRKYRI